MLLNDGRQLFVKVSICFDLRSLERYHFKAFCIFLRNRSSYLIQRPRRLQWTIIWLN